MKKIPPQFDKGQWPTLWRECKITKTGSQEDLSPSRPNQRPITKTTKKIPAMFSKIQWPRLWKEYASKMQTISDFVDKENNITGKILYQVLSNDIYCYFYNNPDKLSSDDIIRNFTQLFKDQFKSENLQQVGKVEISEGWLNNVMVREKYQSYGIGTKLIQLAIEHIGLEYVACVQENRAYEYSLTGAGENLVARCIQKKIIAPDMCRFSGEVPLAEGWEHGDPGLGSFVVRDALPDTINNEV
jgi:hypothetical protein